MTGQPLLYKVQADNHFLNLRNLDLDMRIVTFDFH
jgi:hypothetical protein